MARKTRDKQTPSPFIPVWGKDILGGAPTNILDHEVDRACNAEIQEKGAKMPVWDAYL